MNCTVTASVQYSLAVTEGSSGVAVHSAGLSLEGCDNLDDRPWRDGAGDLSFKGVLTMRTLLVRGLADLIHKSHELGYESKEHAFGAVMNVLRNELAGKPAIIKSVKKRR